MDISLKNTHKYRSSKGPHAQKVKSCHLDLHELELLNSNSSNTCITSFQHFKFETSFIQIIRHWQNVLSSLVTHLKSLKPFFMQKDLQSFAPVPQTKSFWGMSQWQDASFPIPITFKALTSQLGMDPLFVLLQNLLQSSSLLQNGVLGKHWHRPVPSPSVNKLHWAFKPLESQNCLQLSSVLQVGSSQRHTKSPPLGIHLNLSVPFLLHILLQSSSPVPQIGSLENASE